jgi:hypothetical protein
MRKRTPKPGDLVSILKALNTIPCEETKTGWRRSQRGIPNFRVHGVTGELDWFVDTYANQYYVVMVGSRPPEECSSVRSVIAYLCRMLGVKPKSKN